MDKISRRKSLKYITLGSLTAGMALAACNDQTATTPDEHAHHHGASTGMTLSPEDQQLMQETFFTEHEMNTVRVLGDLIIPADDHSGSASDAGVPAFIEFMMKDQPHHQVGMRGGLRWLDVECLNRYEKPFIDCTEAQQHELLDEIAYPDIAKPEMSQGVAFFNRFRDLVATGFWTSEMGIKDLDYLGNKATVWQGAPQEVLDHLGVSYDS